MKIKALAIGLLAASSLVACQAGEETGVDEGNFNGTQNTAFERNADRMDTGDQHNMEAQNNRNNMGGLTNNTGTQNNGNQAGDQTNNNRGNGNENYDVAEKAANNITENVDGVNDAYVLKTENNAYVAAELDNKNGENQVSDKIEKQITKAVKDTDKNINNVYVSSNPDFIDLTNNYADDAQNGEPVEGFFREFGEMVDRIFPDAQ